MKTPAFARRHPLTAVLSPTDSTSEFAFEPPLPSDSTFDLESPVAAKHRGAMLQESLLHPVLLDAVLR